MLLLRRIILAGEKRFLEKFVGKARRSSSLTDSEKVVISPYQSQATWLLKVARNSKF
jgi:hypothetical protein